MSRPIKFRAWDKDNEKILEVKSIHLIENEPQIVINPLEFISSEHVELLQYTGLKDKNGVEIYEGDIVQIKDHSFQKKPGDYTGIEIDGFYPVTYTERMELVAGQWLLMHQLPYITVVGNLYENPELLETN